MLKYKNQITDKLDQAVDQLEKLSKWTNFDRVTKVEHQKICDDILNKLGHCSNLVELEDPK